jgi:hypothetical protein
MLLPLVALPGPSIAQAIPAATASSISTGFALPSLAGTLQYAVSASQSYSSNYFGNSGINSYTNLSGDLAFITNSALYPFNTVFSGGRAWSSSGQSSYNFFNLSMTQGIHAQRWSFALSDSVNYMPGTATSGLSGVPGVGDLGVNPAQPGTTSGTVALPSQGVLTGFSSRISNSSSLSAGRPITGKTSINASGNYSLTRFLSNSANASNPGVNNDSDSASLGLSHRIDARNSTGGSFTYSRSTFSGANFGIPEPGFSSQSASLQYSHQFTRKFGMSASAGPQWNNTGTPGSSSALTLFANLTASYSGEFSQAAMAYTRSSNSGYGVVDGAISNSVSFSTSRILDRVWLCALTTAYTQSSQLPSATSLPFTFHTTVMAVQVSRAIVRNLSAYASYTLQNQSNQGAAAAVDLFSGLSNIAGYGLTYSPTAIHLGHL